MSEDKRKDLCNLLHYAEELLRISEKIVADLSKDAVRVFHEHQIARLEGVSLNCGDGEWIRVARIREAPPPAPGEMLDGWLTGLGALSAPPKLLEKRMIELELAKAAELQDAGLVSEDDILCKRGDDADPNLVDVILHSENMPELLAAYQAYCTGPWQAWVEKERPRRQSIVVYNQLFEAHQRMLASGDDTPIECVMGVGVARWDHPAGRIDAPLIEQMVELHLNDGDGAILVRPRPQPPRVSLRVFDERGVNAAASVQRDAGALLDRIVEDPDGGFSPFDPMTFERVLKTCQARLAGNSVYEGDGAELPAAERPLPRPDAILRVTDSWVLYIRQRSVDFRCDDIRKLRKEIEEVADEAELPPPAVQLASKPKSERVTDDVINLDRDMGELPELPSFGSNGGGSGGGSGVGSSPAPRSLFLPLPFNDEQAEIISKLEQKGAAGVVVQGPPGTGKTHTIANIICHYMARGRRVLVTARTAEALTAIQSKLPDEIRALAISVIHSDREGARQLEEAVGILAQTVANTDRQQLSRDLLDKERRLTEVRSHIDDLDRDIRAYAEQNLTHVRYSGEDLLPMALAARLEAERPAHGWFTDLLDMDERFEPRFTGADIAEARTIRARLGADLIYAAEQIPDPAALPDTAQILAAHGALTREAETDARAVRGDLPYVALSAPNAPELIRATHAWLEEFVAWRNNVSTGGHDWVFSAYQILAEGRSTDAAARETLEKLIAEWSRLQAEGRPFALLGLEASARPGDAAFEAAIEKLSRGEKPFGLFGGGALKAQLAEVRVAGTAPSVKPPIDKEAWAQVRGWWRWQKDVQSFLGRWNAAARVIGLAELPHEVQAGSNDLLRLGSLIERAHALRKGVPELMKAIGLLFPHGVDAREVVVLGKLESVREALAANLDRSSNKSARDIKGRLEALAASAPELPFHAGVASLVDMLGQADTVVPELAEAWSEVVAEAQRLAALREDRHRLEQIAGSVAASGARLWAQRLLTECAETGVDDPLTQPTWRASWDWARASGFIARISDRTAIARMSGRRADLDADQRRLLGEIVRLRTFIGLKQGITEQVAAALAKFVAAVRRIGAGTGKSAERHRRASREAALEAATAVPCWILPEWRVAEQLPSALGCFDLVIVDESSQSDITALPVVLRGKQLLVVGDDKQVSPSAVGIEERLAIQLRETFLKGMPLQSFLDPATSLYDIASMTFPGSVTMLREHFRCVEPIIRFSSRFYPKALIPLRLPTASERLDPPLIDVYVPRGRKDRDVNRAEADWIVDEIEQIARDPATAERSIGVISLIGDKQAKLIQDLLTKRLGTESLVRHKIMCGNAATFQGQERDIMFLSMVACPTTARSQTTRSVEQRFNVAMSRARDRLYLVRSVKASDLSERDLKLAIIEHFERPMGSATIAQPVDVLEVCDSEFERNVGGRLLRLGYRVKAQVPVAGFKIDFVVEGARDKRIAIELDGDKYHGPDRWADDLRRQRALERMGWVFWRCWGSHWLADPEQCMQDLLATLQRHGVEPVSGDFAPTEWTRRITVGAEAVVEQPAQAATPPDVIARDAALDYVSAQPWKASPPVSDPVVEREVLSADGADNPVVEPGDTVIVRFADKGISRTIRISSEEHAPDDGVIGIGLPIAQALLGCCVDEEVEYEVEGRQQLAVIEQITKAGSIAA